MNSSITIFKSEQFGEIKSIELQLKDTYLGVVYALECGSYVKIGSTKSPFSRLTSLLHQSNDYGDVSVGRYAISGFHTNYHENKIAVCQRLSCYRKDDTDLFNVGFDEAVNVISSLELKDESEMIKERGEVFLSGMKDFIYGKTKAPVFPPRVENLSQQVGKAAGANIMLVEDVHGYLDKDNNIWLNAEDVAIGFGFTQEKNGAQYVRWRTINGYLKDFGFSQLVAKGDYLPENMVYRLGFKANNETAQRFQAVLADVILPSIRKTGGYIAATESMTDEEIMARALAIGQKTIERQQQRIRSLEADNMGKQVEIEQKDAVIGLQDAELKKQAPKVNYYDLTMQSTNTMTTTQIAKSIGLEVHDLTQKLRDAGVIYRQSSMWMLRSPYTKWNLHRVRTQTFTRSDGSVSTSQYTVWTERGKRWIVALSENGWNPRRAIKAIQGAISSPDLPAQ